MPAVGWLLLVGLASARAQPSPPTGFVARGEPSRIRLDWSDNSEPDLTGYHVYRSPNAGGPYIRVDGSMTLVAAGSVWRFHDQGTDLGSSWREPGFMDSSWAFGPAPLGHGEEDEATVLSPATDGTPTSPTCYFRQSFRVSDPALFTQLELLLQRDDAAVVYLNGTEVLRDNLPGGDISYRTFALSPVEGDAEKAFHQVLLPPGLLVPGTNVLAVEVHQSGNPDLDVRFDLQLTGLTGTGAHLVQPVPTTATTAAKPQSKVWYHANRWWAVLPDSAGTWLWRLDETEWTRVLLLSRKTTVKADCRPHGNVTHILLFGGVFSELASVEFMAEEPARYRLWPERPYVAGVRLSSRVETATLDVDSTGRMWVASDSANGIEVRYSDPPYAAWSAPIPLASGVASDDICVVTALPDASVGVLWSDQASRRFGFRNHRDGDDPALWSPDEVPASQSALDIGHGMADDHLNVAVGSDGTLYAAVKTSYDTNGYPKIALLVRRPNARWDNLYEVAQSGTRPLVLLNEDLHRVMVVYTSGEAGGDIVFRESSTDRIAFGGLQRLVRGDFNNASSTKQNVSGEWVVLASDGNEVVSLRLLDSLGTSPPSSEFIDYRVTPGQKYHYRVTAQGSQESGFSIVVAASPLPASPDAPASTLSVSPGNVSGNLSDISAEDGASQSINETSTGSKGRAGLVAEYTLVSPVARENVTGLTLQFVGSWTSQDPAESPVATVWNHETAGWDVLGWSIGVSPARSETRLPTPVATYLDAAGGMRIRLSDAADLEREKKDTLIIDLLGGSVRSGPRPPVNLQTIPGDTLVDLAWDPSADRNVLAYDIERDGVRIATVRAETGLTDMGLSNGGLHAYTVRAVNPQGQRSVRSAPATATPDASLPPRVPAGLTAAVGNGHVTLTWRGNLETRMVGYEVYRGTSAPVLIGPGNFLAEVPHAGAGGLDSFEDRSIQVSEPTTFHYALTATDADLDTSAPTPPSDDARVFIEVNQPPSFTGGPDVELLTDAGPQTIPGWAGNISPGPFGFETNQHVAFVVTTDNPTLFADQPAVGPDGTLTLTPAGDAAGMALATVVAMDDGGTAFGGRDTSAPQAFTVTLRFPDCPAPVAQSLRIARDSAKPITLTVDGSTHGLVFEVVSPPSHGTLEGTPPNVLYQPAAGYLGPDAFSFQVHGAQCSGGAVGTINIAVEPPPTLFVESLDDNPGSYRIRWWPDLPGFFLQMADGLDQAWTTAPSGTTNPVVVSTQIGAGHRFYRLVSP